MSNTTDKPTDVVETIEADDSMESPIEAEAALPVVSIAKSKKELKKERKELKKHKKEVKKEAARHSAKSTKAQRVFTSLLCILVCVCMIFCSVTAIKICSSIDAPASNSSGNEGSANAGAPSGGSSSTPSGGSSSSSSSTPSTPSTPDAPAGDNTAEGGAAGGDAAPAGDLSTPAGVVEYVKTAYAKVMSSAKSVTRTYDNTINYKDTLDIGGNSTLAGIAKTLMNQFMKENTEKVSFSGGDMAANFPGKNTIAGLTADMLSEATCKDEGDKYVITLVVNSSEESPDLGEKSGKFCNIVDEKQVTEAAGNMVKLEGLENRYIAPKAVITVDKATGNITNYETTTPSYMCFARASVAIIKVDNCRIGLEYQQKWTVEW